MQVGRERLEMGILGPGGGIEDSAEVQVQAEDQGDGNPDGQRQGLAPRMLGHLRRAAQYHEHEQHVHERERCEAVSARRFDLEHGDQGQEPAHARTDACDEQGRSPSRRFGAQTPHQTCEDRVGEQPPQRHRHAEQRRPSARLHEVALRLRPAVRRVVAEPGDQRQVAGEQDTQSRETEEPVVEGTIRAFRHLGPGHGSAAPGRRRCSPGPAATGGGS